MSTWQILNNHWIKIFDGDEKVFFGKLLEVRKFIFNIYAQINQIVMLKIIGSFTKISNITGPLDNLKTMCHSQKIKVQNISLVI